jgi:hypothetical protein
VTIVESDRFISRFAGLPESIKTRARKQLALFLQDWRHPSLHTEKAKGHRNLWIGRITHSYRFIFRIEGDTYVLLDIGRHDIEGQF